MAVVMENPYITVSTDADAPIVRYTRTAQPYTSLLEMDRLHDDIGRALDHLSRQRHSLLVDMRAAPMNNGDAFERSAARAREIIVRDFVRVAVLVRTAVGTLQVSRHIRESSREMAVFQDEFQALAYLRGEHSLSDRPPPRSTRTGEEAPPSGERSAPVSSRRASVPPLPSVRSRR